MKVKSRKFNFIYLSRRHWKFMEWI